MARSVCAVQIFAILLAFASLLFLVIACLAPLGFIGARALDKRMVTWYLGVTIFMVVGTSASFVYFLVVGGLSATQIVATILYIVARAYLAFYVGLFHRRLPHPGACPLTAGG